MKVKLKALDPWEFPNMPSTIEIDSIQDLWRLMEKYENYFVIGGTLEKPTVTIYNDYIE